MTSLLCSGVSTYDKFYCAVGGLLMTSFTVQEDVRLWQVLLCSGVSAYDKFYCAVECPPMTSFTVQWGVRLWQVLLCSGVSDYDGGLRCSEMSSCCKFYYALHFRRWTSGTENIRCWLVVEFWPSLSGDSLCHWKSGGIPSAPFNYFLSFSCSFRQKSWQTNSGVAPPSLGKSWIRHCM